jgi:hypothetical protein
MCLVGNSRSRRILDPPEHLPSPQDNQSENEEPFYEENRIQSE